MSKSIRHTPIFGHTCAKSEKKDKRIANRRYRRIVRSLLTCGAEELPLLKETSDPWGFAKDGKSWMGEWARAHPKSMRK